MYAWVWGSPRLDVLQDTSQQPLTVAVTGASGYLGELVLNWLSVTHSHCRIIGTFRNNQPIVLRDLASRKPFNALKTLIESKYPSASGRRCDCDLCQPRIDLLKVDLLSSASALSADVFIHCAAMTAPSACERNQRTALATNNPVNWFTAVRSANPKAYVIALSTDHVYDGTELFDTSVVTGDCTQCGNCSVEHAHICHLPRLAPPTPNALNIYGKSKVAMENTLVSLFPKRHAILRSSIIYGPNVADIIKSNATAEDISTDFAEALCKKKGSFLHFLLRSFFESSERTTLFSNEIRCFSFVFDVCHCVSQLVSRLSTSPICGVFDCSGPCVLDRPKFAQLVFEHFGSGEEQFEDRIKAMPREQCSFAWANVAPVPRSLVTDSRPLYSALGHHFTAVSDALDICKLFL